MNSVGTPRQFLDTNGPHSRSAAEPQFRATTIVADALAMHPKARWVLAAYHVRGCGACDHSSRETLEEVASAYRFPLDSLLDDLNALLP